MLQNLKKYAPWVLLIICLVASLWAWYHPKEKIVTKTEYQDRTKTVYVKVKIPVKEVQGTGEDLQGTPIVATADCPPSRSGQDVVSTISTTTGEVKILIKEKKLSLFEFRDDKEIGIRYNGVRGGAYGRWTFIRVGSLYGALYAEVNSKPDSQVMAEVSYRF